MHREVPFNPEEIKFSGENNEEQKATEQKPKELIDQEKTDLALKETAKAFKEALNPKSAIKKAKEFFGK